MIRLVQNWISKEESRTPKPSQAIPSSSHPLHHFSVWTLLITMERICLSFCVGLWLPEPSGAAPFQTPPASTAAGQGTGQPGEILPRSPSHRCRWMVCRGDLDSRTLVTDLSEVVWRARVDCPWLQSPLLAPRRWLGLLKQQRGSEAMVTHCINKQLSLVYQEITCLVVSSKLAFQFIF